MKKKTPTYNLEYISKDSNDIHVYLKCRYTSCKHNMIYFLNINSQDSHRTNLCDISRETAMDGIDRQIFSIFDIEIGLAKRIKCFKYEDKLNTKW
jgi:hypothetical protein